MSQTEQQQADWLQTVRSLLRPQSVGMFFLGFSAGLPILLIFSTLSVWLREAGVARSAVTFFSWAALGYSFKFLWAPLIDLLPLPLLGRLLGRRRGWLLLSQGAIVAAICLMAMVDPAGGTSQLTMMALAAVLLGFSSATQDIVIDAFRIECAESSLQALLASMYIAGYRVGMLVAGAGSLVLASYLGSGATGYSYYAWRLTYFAMAATMVVGIITTLLVKEPQASAKAWTDRYHASDYGRLVLLFLIAVTSFAVSFFYGGELVAGRLVGALFPGAELKGVLGFLVELLRFCLAVGCAAISLWGAMTLKVADKEMVELTYLAPVREFFSRYALGTALLVLSLVGLYRLSDIVLGVVSNVFYLDMGFSKNVIAGVTKSFGLGMTLLGGFCGGFLTVRYGVIRILFLGGFLSAATNLLFMVLAQSRGDVGLLTLVIGCDNLSAGIATTAFVAFLSSLTNVSFTAVQYAIFSSMMTLIPKLIGGYSGSMVAGLGYETFFMLTALMGIPVLLLILLVGKLIDVKA